MPFQPDFSPVTSPGGSTTSTPPDFPLPAANAPVLALALGLSPTQSLARHLRDTLPAQHLPQWQVRDVGHSTDTLMDSAMAMEVPWTTLLVTNKLAGTQPLVSVLAAIRDQQPTVRVVVLCDKDTPETRNFVAQCAQLNIYNVLVGAIDEDRLVSLLTTDVAWHESLAKTYVVQQPNLAPVWSDPASESAPATAPPPSLEPPEPADLPQDHGRGHRGLWQSRLQRAEGAPVRPRPHPSSPVILRPHRLLLLGSQGGVGVSTLTVLLAQAWRRAGLPVAVVDAASTGGFLPLGWQCDPVEQGWERQTRLSDAWMAMPDGCLVLPQSGGIRPMLPHPAAWSALREALLTIPGDHSPAVLVDGGTDPAWVGTLMGAIDGVLVVVTPDAMGLQAGTRLLDTLHGISLPVVGVVVNRRRRSARIPVRGMAELWSAPILADWLEDSDVWDTLWTDQCDPRLRSHIQPLAEGLVMQERKKKGRFGA